MKALMGLGIVVIIVLIYFFTRDSSAPINFVGYFYPYGAYHEESIESPAFETIEDCIQWIGYTQGELIEKGYDKSNFDYECLKDCDYGDKYNQGVNYTCKETVY